MGVGVEWRQGGRGATDSARISEVLRLVEPALGLLHSGALEAAGATVPVPFRRGAASGVGAHAPAASSEQGLQPDQGHRVRNSPEQGLPSDGLHSVASPDHQISLSSDSDHGVQRTSKGLFNVTPDPDSLTRLTLGPSPAFQLPPEIGNHAAPVVRQYKGIAGVIRSVQGRTEAPGVGPDGRGLLGRMEYCGMGSEGRWLQGMESPGVGPQGRGLLEQALDEVQPLLVYREWLPDALAVWIADSIERKAFEEAASFEEYLSLLEGARELLLLLPGSAGEEGHASPYPGASNSPVVKGLDLPTVRVPVPRYGAEGLQEKVPGGAGIGGEAWEKHREMRAKHLLQLQTSFLSLSLRIQGSSSCAGAARGSARASRLPDRKGLGHGVRPEAPCDGAGAVPVLGEGEDFGTLHCGEVGEAGGGDPADFGYRAQAGREGVFVRPPGCNGPAASWSKPHNTRLEATRMPKSSWTSAGDGRHSSQR